MAGNASKDWGNLDLTREEVENLKEALKKDEFRKLLSEYAEEITNPENRKQYQDEIIQLEAERGVDCTFINPEPGFVVKTSADGKKKAFINICKNNAIGRPWSKPMVKDSSKGLSWSIPFSQSPGREDHDKKRNRCVVYDVVFHPNTLRLAENNSQFKKLVVDTALNAIEGSYNVKLDKKNLKYPKLKFKGIPVATVIRKMSKNKPVLTEDEIEFQKNIKYPAPPPLNDDKKPVIRNFDHIKDDKEKYTMPKYIIKHSSGIDLEEFTYDKNCKMNAAIPKELVIEINLPLLSSTKEAVLDVMEKSIHLICEKPAKYKLDIQLPYAVNKEEGNAKFDKDQRVLIITLPVIRSKKNVSDLMREDSGVESDFVDCCRSCDDASPVGSVDNEKEIDDEYSAPCQIISESELSDLSKTLVNEDSTIKKTSRTSFLDEDKLYLLPPYKCNADDNCICFILNVKNVDPDSLNKQLQHSNGCHIKFLTLGSGFCPIFYAMFLKFNDCIIKNVETDVWDNNVILRIELDKSKVISNYYVGINEDSLELKDLIEVAELESKFQKIKLETKEKYEKDEKDEKDEEDREISSTVVSANINEVAIKISAKKNRKYSKKNKNKEKVETDKKLRTFSESSTEEVILSPVARKSILKNRICRSLSESNAEDYALGSSIEASEGSDMCISEENEEPHGAKKTVRFNDRIGKQLFRANASILSQKKKNQKRSRNKRKVSERRTSESENSEYEEKEKDKRTNDPLIEEIEDKGKESECDIMEGAISEENENVSEEVKDEIRFSAKKDDKIFEFKSDLIFDLDR